MFKRVYSQMWLRVWALVSARRLWSVGWGDCQGLRPPVLLVHMMANTFPREYDIER